MYSDICILCMIVNVMVIPKLCIFNAGGAHTRRNPREGFRSNDDRTSQGGRGRGRASEGYAREGKVYTR